MNHWLLLRNSSMIESWVGRGWGMWREGCGLTPATQVSNHQSTHYCINNMHTYVCRWVKHVRMYNVGLCTRVCG